MARLSLENVSKAFSATSGKKIQAVAGISLDLGQEELLTLVGPSGSGKTTLLRLIAGLEETDSGTISINGKSVNEVPARDRDIAMVFQSYALYPNMPVFQNIALGLKLRKVPRPEIESRVREVGEMLGLVDLFERDPQTLSGGQRQRVALGRALARRPSLLLLDEPLSGLDSRLRGQMRRELAALQKQLGLSMLYVTHDQEEAMSLGQRVAVLRDGSIQQIGSPRDVYARPRNSFVAEFFGNPPMNFFNGDIVNGGTRLCFQQKASTAGTLAEKENARSPQQLEKDLTFFRLELPERLASPLATHSEKAIILGVRPEHLQIAKASTQTAAEITGMLERIEMLGGQNHLHLRIGGAHCVARVGSADGLPVNENVSLELDMSHIHFFERSTGERIDT